MCPNSNSFIGEKDAPPGAPKRRTVAPDEYFRCRGLFLPSFFYMIVTGSASGV